MRPGRRQKSAAPWLRLGRLHARAERLDEAIACCRRALEQAPDNPLALNSLAVLLLEHGSTIDEDYTLALRAHELAPERPLIADTLGWACYLKQLRLDRPDVWRVGFAVSTARKGSPKGFPFLFLALIWATGKRSGSGIASTSDRGWLRKPPWR